MRNANVDGGASGYVARFANHVLTIGAEEPSVVALLNDDVRDARAVIALQFDTRLSNRRQLVVQHFLELSLGHGVAIKDDSVGLEMRRLVKLHQQLADWKNAEKSKHSPFLDS
jgi:hypothetical protein